MAAEDRDLNQDRDLNRDPITEEPGAHPVGTGIGATGGAVAGAAMGVVGGPLGMAVGGVVGAVVGGLAGKAAAEAVNPTAEEAHWRENYTREPYYEQGRSFDDYGPAYRHGLNARTQYEGDWDSAEPRMASEWDNARAGSGLSWQQAQPASRAAWERVDRMRTGGEAGMGMAASGSMGSMGSGGTSSGNALGMDNSAGMGNAAGLGSDPALMGASDGMRGNVNMDSSYNTAGTDLARSAGAAGGMGGSSMGTDRGVGGQSSNAGTGGMGAAGGEMATGAAGIVGAAQSAGNNSGDTKDVIDALQDLVECCKDGEYGFRACAEQAQRQDLKSMFLQRADDCRRGAQQLNEQIRNLGGTAEDSGSALGAVHRGWVAVKTSLTSYDDKSVLEEAERGEDNALARYRKALKQPLPEHIKQIVEKQYQGVQKNHDQVKMLRDSTQG
ncbi:MAG TPA: PA2169 family four-helix-bundle protein [Ramlibacter sp.]|nr:PA2169 family four-helix-bundle protein [Ramlibacter sp.]